MTNLTISLIILTAFSVGLILGIAWEHHFIEHWLEEDDE